VLLGDNQGCPGWCVLLLKEHHEHLADLQLQRQLGIFAEVSRIAAAIRSVFPTSGKNSAPPRINYECLGNLVPHIHWHIIPRHADDPDPTKAVWTWPDSQLKGAMTQEERTTLITKLRAAL
jgi:diadenosine tetraphosphate (Ap4A) HIT family hydrolase